MYFKLVVVISLFDILTQADERRCRRVQIKNQKMHGECCIFVREENENVREEIQKLLEDTKPESETIRPIGAPPPPPSGGHHHHNDNHVHSLPPITTDSPNSARPFIPNSQDSQYLPPRLGNAQLGREKPPLEHKNEGETIPADNVVNDHTIILESQSTKQPVNGNECNCKDNKENKDSISKTSSEKIPNTKPAVAAKANGSDSFVFPSEENATSSEPPIKNHTSTNTTGKVLFDNRNAVDAPTVNCPDGKGRDPDGTCANGF